MQKQDNKIAAQINLIKLPSNTKYEFVIDQHTSWMQEILLELNENATYSDSRALLEATSLSVSGELEKKNKPDLGEFLTINGTVSAHYATECVRTLKPMKVDLEIPFKVCFMDQSLEDTEMFKETDETWVENDVYEIYYYDKRTVNFKEMIHEQIFLHYNQYPVLDAESSLEGISEERSKS
jgi:hypothetical protein